MKDEVFLEAGQYIPQQYTPNEFVCTDRCYPDNFVILLAVNEFFLLKYFQSFKDSLNFCYKIAISITIIKSISKYF